MSHFKMFKPCLLGLLVFPVMPASARDIKPVLDGYAYQFNSNMVIDFNNEIINFSSNMINCQQLNGQPPLDTSVFAVTTNKQVIGLRSVNYKINTNTIYFTSETGDLFCTNGIFTDTIYSNGFE